MNSKKFCPYCGTEIADSSAFCPYCGKKVETPENNPVQYQNQPTTPAPGYVPPASPPPKKSRGSIIASIATVVVIVLIAIGIIAGGGLFKKYEEGTLTDTTYKSEFIGVRYEVSGDYELEEPDRAELGLEDNTYDEMITFNDENHIFLAVVEGESPLFTEKSYLDGVKEEMPSDMYTNIDDSYDTITIAGEKYKVLTAEVEDMGITLKQSFCARKIGKYVVVFMVTQTDDESLEDILSDFEEY